MKEDIIPKNLSTRNTCRVCGNEKLEEITSLGNQVLVNFLDISSQKKFSAPLDLILCNKTSGGCGLLQLKHTVPGDLLYKQFWYKSGVNQTMKDALLDVVTKSEKLISLRENDIVVDIGSNDSTLLRSYSTKNLVLVGFEPATNLLDEAKKGTTKIFNDYFNSEKFIGEFGERKAKLITSISMFYDLEDPNKFVDDVVKILDKDGIFIIQMNYLVSMLDNKAFDNIVHEHLEYYSLIALEYLLSKHNLSVFDVEFNDLNGGSIRTYVKHKQCDKYPQSDRVQKTRDKEEKMGLQNHEVYYKFAEDINNLKAETYQFIKNEVDNGKKIYVYGASTRGSTLLQFFNLDNKLIEAAADRNPIKWDKIIAGTEIPIISEESARKENPDYFLILPWYFIEEFKIREKEYLEKGGKFIVPLPKFDIIGT